jgi:hypothetical protein
MKITRNTLLTAAGILAGGIGGYLYWQYVGCASGTCAITSRPLNSTLYGSMMGGLFFSMFHNKTTKN